MKTPKWKCGNPCKYYGQIEEFSVACKTCNERNSKRQRIARLAKKMLSASVSPNKADIKWAMRIIKSKSRL